MTTTATRNRRAKATPPSSQRRLVVVTGNKGGCGKSIFARGLLDLYQHWQVPCIAYDSDTQNAQLFRHYAKAAAVSRMDIAKRGSADRLLEEMEQPLSSVILMDLPAGGGQTFQRYEQDIELIAAAIELNYRLTLVSVMSRVKDSVNALRQVMDYCGDRVDYVAVKNLHFGEAEKFKRFDQSKTREQFFSLGGVEIAMPDLFDDTFDLIDEQDLAFRQGLAEGSSLNRAHRSRLNQWLKTLETETHKAADYLGIPHE
jgi:NAD(P)-dependent dehydrogenase (short-subunit alcohol dehydrogenase family)